MKICFNIVSLIHLLCLSSIALSESSPRDLYSPPSLQTMYSAPLSVTPKDPADFSARWAYMFYYGKMSHGSVAQSLYFKPKFDVDYGRADQYSLEVAYSVGKENFLKKIFQPITLVSNIELVANASFINDQIEGTIWQFNPYIMGHWRNFPWDRFITTTFGLGEGISWSTKVPSKETIDIVPQDVRKVLNLMIFEVTFALPQHPNLQLVYRVHHRSGVFGLYSPSLVASNVMGFGLRYWA